MSDEGVRLQSAFGFSSEELALNRGGSVSGRQQSMLTQAKTTTRTANLVMIAVVVLFAGVAGGIAASSSSELVLPIVGAVALVALVMGLSIRRTLRAGARIAMARVQHAEGPAKHRIVRLHGNVEDPTSMGSVRYEIEVGGERLVVGTQSEMESFVEGAPYRVHFVREASLHVLLSAEPI